MVQGCSPYVHITTTSMSGFKEILFASHEELIQVFYKIKADKTPVDDRLNAVAEKMKMRPEQLVCAFGFNPESRELPELLPILGFLTIDELVKKRNDIFTTDIYKMMTLDNILSIYAAIKDDPESLQSMQYLLKNRLATIEEKIESTVNSLVIEKYKAEMRSIYNDGIANIDFAEERLNNKDSGFRALLNEVSIIIESKLIPAGDIFFRDTIHPEEKRKLLNKGLIPVELVKSRLEDDATSPDEKKILSDYLKANQKQQ